MNVVILAGGRGTRLAEETSLRPKPMVEIGGRPILCHIMDFYAAHGHRDFLVACGYKGEVIKEYFHNLTYHSSDIEVDLRSGQSRVIAASPFDWRVRLIDTGLDTMTGGRLRRLRGHLGAETFMATYGDGLSDLEVPALLDFHRSHGRLATVTAVRPPARFGGLVLEGRRVVEFTEKPQTGEGWINGGFFVLEPQVLDFIDGDETMFEREPLERLAKAGSLMAFPHEGFWHPMDTIRDRQVLEELWSGGKAPWRSPAR